MLVLVGVLLAVLLTRGGGGADPSATGPSTATSAPPTTSASSAPPSSAPASSSAAPTTESASAAPTTASSAPAPRPGPGTRCRVQRLRRPSWRTTTGCCRATPPRAYQLTGPTLRGAESYPNYRAFWGQFSAVSLSDVAVQSPTSATGVLSYTYPDGSTQRELHSFRLVQGNGGQLLLDSDTSERVLKSR